MFARWSSERHGVVDVACSPSEGDDLLALCGLGDVFSTGVREAELMAGFVIRLIDDIEVLGWPMTIFVDSPDNIRPCTADALRVMVVDNAYLTLRRAVVAQYRYDALLVVGDSARPLTVRDVQHTLGGLVYWWERSTQVARSSDAGLLVVRAGEPAEWAERLWSMAGWDG